MQYESTNPVVAAVREVAAAEPGFRYTEQPERTRSLSEYGHAPCSYVSAYPGLPEGRGCIIGQALTKTGVDVTALVDLERGAGIGVSRLIKMRPEWFGEDSSPDDRRWLAHVQGTQDAGQAWADAVDSADNELARVKQLREQRGA